MIRVETRRVKILGRWIFSFGSGAHLSSDLSAGIQVRSTTPNKTRGPSDRFYFVGELSLILD
jgi:hypothetical protein